MLPLCKFCALTCHSMTFLHLSPLCISDMVKSYLQPWVNSSFCHHCQCIPVKHELAYLAAKSITAFAHDLYTDKSILNHLLSLVHSRVVKRNASISVACLGHVPPELCCHHGFHSMSSLSVYLLLASVSPGLSHRFDGATRVLWELEGQAAVFWHVCLAYPCSTPCWCLVINFALLQADNSHYFY